MVREKIFSFVHLLIYRLILVSDSLDYSPEKCTIVASYHKIVVGVAIMSSPRETYITYLAVKHGWDNSNIATYVHPLTRWCLSLTPRRTMLYQLIMLNPGKDITLHVSANNSAMVPLIFGRLSYSLLVAYPSCCIIALVSSRRNLLLAFTMLIWTPNLELPRTPSAYACDIIDCFNIRLETVSLLYSLPYRNTIYQRSIRPNAEKADLQRFILTPEISFWLVSFQVTGDYQTINCLC